MRKHIGTDFHQPPYKHVRVGETKRDPRFDFVFAQRAKKASLLITDSKSFAKIVE